MTNDDVKLESKSQLDSQSMDIIYHTKNVKYSYDAIRTKFVSKAITSSDINKMGDSNFNLSKSTFIPLHSLFNIIDHSLMSCLLYEFDIPKEICLLIDGFNIDNNCIIGGNQKHQTVMTRMDCNIIKDISELKDDDNNNVKIEFGQ